MGIFVHILSGSETLMKEQNKTQKVELKKTVVNEQINEKYKDVNTTAEKNENDDDKITLSEVIKYLEKKKEGKVSETAQEAFMKRLNIKSFLPLERKSQILIRIVMGVVYAPEFVSEMAAIDLEFRKLFYCLLAYTDVDVNSIDEYPLDFSTYDIFIESGLYDTILSICQRDYERLEKLITEAISFESVMQVTMNVAQMEPDKMQEDLKEVKNFLNDMDSQDLQSLSQIATLTDPLVHDIAQLIRDKKI